MKNKIVVYIVIISTFSFNNWAQQSLSGDKIVIPVKKVKYYHVEEIVSAGFGGSKRVYDVTDSKLIQTYDLGPTGKRTITPVFEDEGQQNLAKTAIKPEVINKTKKTTELSINDIQKKEDTHYILVPKNKNTITPNTLSPEIKPNDSPIKLDTSNKIKNPIELSITETSKKEHSPIYINVTEVYKRVVEKGYESIEILKKTGDSYYFKNEFKDSEKIYARLFNNLTTPIEPEYYYRYSISLKSENKINLADYYMKKYNELKNNSPKK